MTRFLRPLVILLMLVALASVPTAPWAGGTGATQMVICGSTGAETIWLNAAGDPAPAPTPCCDCPDCLTTPPALPVAQTATVQRQIAARRAGRPRQATLRATRDTPARLPRGPPDAMALGREQAAPALYRIAPAPLALDQGLRGQGGATGRANPKDART